MNYRFYLIDDDPTALTLLETLCEELDYPYLPFENGEAALEKWSETKEKCVFVCDYTLPEMNGLDLLRKLKEEDSEIPFILVTANGSSEVAVNALEMGALDYVTKPVNPKEMMLVFKRAIQHLNFRKSFETLNRKIKKSTEKSGFLYGETKEMLKLKRLVEKVSPTDAPLLITGETGTGKEVLSKEVHRLSQRADKPFLALNCASIPENLLESELFGHKKGAFSGATENREGLFIAANGGTLLLDEIGDMPLNLQSKLLRVLQEGKVKRIGENEEISIDVRIIAATHKDINNEILNGGFREDLYYRLSVFNVHIPPLRERRDDVDLFFSFFRKRYSKKNIKLSKEALIKLQEHYWPGNVREFENTIRRALLMGDGIILQEEDLVFNNIPVHKEELDFRLTFKDWPSLKELEKIYIAKLFLEKDFSKEKIAQVLGVNRKTLYRKIKEYELEN